MRTLGKDKSTAKRGQRQTTRVIYGQHGSWLGIPQKWEFEPGEWVNTFCLDDGEKLHVIFVPADKREREEVFKSMGSTWSWSKHLATKLLFEAVFLNPKPVLWVHGLVTLKVVQRSIAGIEERQAERPKKVQAPWLKNRMEAARDYTPEESKQAPETVTTRL